MPNVINPSSRLWLLPNLLDEAGEWDRLMPPQLSSIVSSLNGLIAESEKAARRYLKRFAFPSPKTFRDVPLRLLNEHSSSQDIDALLTPLLGGECWGLISDSGMPCLADPGSDLVLKARLKGIPVDVVPGPSSLLLGLMLSGLGAQRFTFHGYLPKEEVARIAALKDIQRRSLQEKSTHLFIEAPYRNEKLAAFLLTALPETTLLCLATDLTGPTQQVLTQSIGTWKKAGIPSIDGHPTLFLIRAVS